MTNAQSVADRRLGAQPKRSRSRPPASRHGLPPWWVVLPAVLGVGIVHFIFPTIGGFFAFTDWRGVGPFEFVGFDNFVRMFQEPIVRDSFFRTLALTIGFVILTSVFGILLALALNSNLKSRQPLRALFFLPFVISPLATAYVWQYVFGYAGPLNQILGAIGLKDLQQVWLGDPDVAIFSILVVMIWQYVGLAMILYLAGLQNVPDEVLEAAMLDGAGPWKRFRLIILPYLAPAMTVATVLLTLWGLRVFDQVIALTGGGPVGATETLSTQIWRQVWVNGNFGYGAAISITLTIIVIAVTLTQTLILRRRENNV